MHAQTGVDMATVDKECVEWIYEKSETSEHKGKREQAWGFTYIVGFLGR